jgi:hypothetical protein
MGTHHSIVVLGNGLGIILGNRLGIILDNRLGIILDKGLETGFITGLPGSLRSKPTNGSSSPITSSPSIISLPKFLILIRIVKIRRNRITITTVVQTRIIRNRR